MNATHMKWAARLFVTIGVVTILGEVARNWIDNHPIEGWVVAIGAGFGFFGFYLMDAKRAKDAFGFAIDNGVVKIVGAVRGGRRSTDSIVAVTETVKPAAPPDAPADTMSEEGG